MYNLCKILNFRENQSNIQCSSAKINALKVNIIIVLKLLCYILFSIFIAFFTLVKGKWGEWGNYSACPTTCGVAQQVRYRYCDNPAPINSIPCETTDGGTALIDTETQECTVDCDGGWTDWQCVCSNSSSKYQTRNCTNPSPFGITGKDCTRLDNTTGLTESVVNASCVCPGM